MSEDNKIRELEERIARLEDGVLWNTNKTDLPQFKEQLKKGNPPQLVEARKFASKEKELFIILSSDTQFAYRRHRGKIEMRERIQTPDGVEVKRWLDGEDTDVHYLKYQWISPQKVAEATVSFGKVNNDAKFTPSGYRRCVNGWLIAKGQPLFDLLENFYQENKPKEKSRNLFVKSGLAKRAKGLLR